MHLEETEEQILIAGTIDRFLTDKIDPSQAGSGPVEADHWRKFAELGVLQWLVPERGGGMGGEADKIISVARLLGKHLCVSPISESVLGAAYLIAEAGNEEQIARYLGDLLAGRGHIAWVGGEPAYPIAARRDGEGWRLSGKIRFARWGDIADHLLILAHDGDRVRPFVVPAKTIASQSPSRILADMSSARQIELTNFPVSSDALICATECQLETAENRIKLCRSAQLVGITARIFDDTRLYTRQRWQFSVSIGSFQVIQHYLARMFISYEQSISALYRAGLSGLGEEDGPSRLDNALEYIAENALRVAQTGVQIFGGMGITNELPVSRAHRQVLVLSRLPPSFREKAIWNQASDALPILTASKAWKG